jgi:hypothetical protein
MNYGCMTEAAILSALCQMWGTGCGVLQCFAGGKKELLL